ncbi:hypothetical protein EMN47_16205 [Prolixibacteraceae bacterium JC049]|nr:hypothetical protein [Prolixibacteraceae bacterium JC049]
MKPNKLLISIIMLVFSCTISFGSKYEIRASFTNYHYERGYIKFINYDVEKLFSDSIGNIHFHIRLKSITTDSKANGYLFTSQTIPMTNKELGFQVFSQNTIKAKLNKKSGKVLISNLDSLKRLYNQIPVDSTQKIYQFNDITSTLKFKQIINYFYVPEEEKITTTAQGDSWFSKAGFVTLEDKDDEWALLKIGYSRRVMKLGTGNVQYNLADQIVTDAKYERFGNISNIRLVQTKKVKVIRAKTKKELKKNNSSKTINSNATLIVKFNHTPPENININISKLFYPSTSNYFTQLTKDSIAIIPLNLNRLSNININYENKVYYKQVLNATQKSNNKKRTISIFGNINLILEPGDYLYAEIDSTNQIVNTEGLGSRNNKYYLSYIEKTNINSNSHYALNKELPYFDPLHTSLDLRRYLYWDSYFKSLNKEFDKNTRYTYNVNAREYFKKYAKKFKFMQAVSIDNKFAIGIPSYYVYLRHFLEFKYAQLKFNHCSRVPEIHYLTTAHLLFKPATRYYFYSRFKDQLSTKYHKTTLLDLMRKSSEEFPYSKVTLQLKKLGHGIQQIEAGQPFPKIPFVNLNNKEVTLSKYKGKVIYMHFWRNSSLAFDINWMRWQELYQLYAKEDIVFLHVATEKTLDEWKRFINGASFKGEHLWVGKPEKKVLDSLLITNSRHYMLIDKHGIIQNNNGPLPVGAKNNISKLLQEPYSAISSKTLTRIALILLALIIIIGSYFLVYYIRQKRQQKILILKEQMRELELKVIRSQMNPHFLFNALNSIQNLINQNKIEATNLYLSRFAGLLRNTLRHSEKELIPLEKEIDTLTLYCELEQLRFDFDLQINIDPEIDRYNTFIPPVLIQPFVENAILHGLSPKLDNKALIINIIKSDSETIQCQIIDNGVGRNHATESKGNGMGIKLSKERIDSLQNHWNSTFSIEFIDLKDDEGPTGTQVNISFSENLL